MAQFPASWWSENRPLILAHRGARTLAPENTVAAFRAAETAGADGVELDVDLSADGVPIVIHDRDVDRTTDGSGLAGSMTLRELKQLDAGVRFAPAAAGERIPTLEEALTCFTGRMLVNIELKDQGSRQGLEKAVVEVVRQTGAGERVWFSSFKPSMLARVRELAPEIPCGLLYDPRSIGVLLLAPVTPYEALHPYVLMTGERAIRRAHRRGLKVAAWTVNSVDQARQLAAAGIDVLISDVPADLVPALRR